jgi:hypothetical protein
MPDDTERLTERDEWCQRWYGRGLTEDYDAAIDALRRNGSRRCDIPACNCGGWHGGSALARLNEIRDTLSEDVDLNGKTILDGIYEVLNDRRELRNMLAAIRIVLEEDQNRKDGQ